MNDKPTPRTTDLPSDVLHRLVIGAVRSFADAHPEAFTDRGRSLTGSLVKRVVGAIRPEFDRLEHEAANGAGAALCAIGREWDKWQAEEDESSHV